MIIKLNYTNTTPDTPILLIFQIRIVLYVIFIDFFMLENVNWPLSFYCSGGMNTRVFYAFNLFTLTFSEINFMRVKIRGYLHFTTLNPLMISFFSNDF